MNSKLTRNELDDKLRALRAQAARIARDYPVGDQVEAVAGEAEVLEQRVAPVDIAYFHDSVEAIILEAGMLQPEATHE